MFGSSLGGREGIQCQSMQGLAGLTGGSRGVSARSPPQTAAMLHSLLLCFFISSGAAAPGVLAVSGQLLGSSSQEEEDMVPVLRHWPG